MKFKIAKLEDVEESLRQYYKQGQDGAYYLDVEGAVAKERLDEFRNNNVDLTKRLEAFKDLDPAKVQELLENERKIAEKKLIDAGDIEGLVNQRIAAMKTDHDRKVAEMTTQLGTANRQLETLLIDNSVREVASKIGVVPSAVDDVLLRAKTVFKVENGAPVAKDSAGNTVYGKDGTSSLNIGEWLGGLKEQAPHLFATSSGSGARNQGPGNINGNKNLSPAQKISAGLQSGASEAIQ